MCIPALFHSPGKYMLQENSSSVSLFDALKSYLPNSFSLFRSLSRLFKPCSFENLLNNFHTAPAAARFNAVNELNYGPHAPRFFFPFGSGSHTKMRFFLTLHSAFLKVGILPSESWKINSLICCSQMLHTASNASGESVFVTFFIVYSFLICRFFLNAFCYPPKRESKTC